MITAENGGGVVRVEAQGWKVMTATAAGKRAGNGEQLLLLPSSHIHRDVGGEGLIKRNRYRCTSV